MNCLEHSTAAGHRQSSGDDACEPEWRTHLPTQWRECVVTPLELNVHREYEIPASRMLGREGRESTHASALAAALGGLKGPLMKVASGGELSRFLLALKVSLADRGSAPTLVFDEIDSGVGGAVSDAIGQRLKRLAGRVQVLSVTHAPQVAARADEHFLISKSPARNSDEERVATAVSRVEGEHRREEIARMLAGATVTQEARAAAEKLIVGAEG